MMKFPNSNVPNEMQTLNCEATSVGGYLSAFSVVITY